MFNIMKTADTLKVKTVRIPTLDNGTFGFE